MTISKNRIANIGSVFDSLLTTLTSMPSSWSYPWMSYQESSILKDIGGVSCVSENILPCSFFDEYTLPSQFSVQGRHTPPFSSNLRYRACRKQVAGLS